MCVCGRFSAPSLINQVSRITETALGQVPAEFKSAVRSMLAIEPNVRPDALQITKVRTHHAIKNHLH